MSRLPHIKLSSRPLILLFLTLGIIGLLGILGVNGKIFAAVSDPISTPVSPSPTNTASPSVEPSASSSATPSFSPTPSASSSASPSIAPSPSATASALPSTSPSPTPSPIGQVITFNDFNGQNTPLNGQFPQGVAEWGQNVWFVASPIGGFDSKSIRFNDNWGRSETFNFTSPKTVKVIDIYNSANFPALVYMSCRSFGWPFFNVAWTMVDPLETKSLQTGWSAKCANVKLFSSRGDKTFFDNLTIQ